MAPDRKLAPPAPASHFGPAQKRGSGSLRSMYEDTIDELMALLVSRASGLGYAVEYASGRTDRTGQILRVTDALHEANGSPEKAAPEELAVVLELSTALFWLADHIDRGPGNEDWGEWMRAAILLALSVGSRAERLGLKIRGHDFGEDLKIKEQYRAQQEARQAGAEETNQRKRDVKQAALRIAENICRTNPTLSNENLAAKTHERARLSLTIKTVTEWVREWRRKGSLPPIGQRPAEPGR